MLFMDSDNPFELYINTAKDFLQMLWEKILKLCLQIKASFNNFFYPQPSVTPENLHQKQAPNIDVDDELESVHSEEDVPPAPPMSPVTSFLSFEALLHQSNTTDTEADVVVPEELQIQPTRLIENLDPKLFILFLSILARLFYVYTFANSFSGNDSEHGHHLRP